MNNESIFENLTPRDGRLTITGKSLRITEREIAKIMLLNNSAVKLASVLMMLDIETNLLSTQALLTHGIENH